jgi:hypothetical protein
VSRLRSFRSAFALAPFVFVFLLLLASCVALAGLAHGQTYVAIQEVRVSDLPVVVARSKEPSDVLQASLATIFHDKSVCCGKDSALALDESVAKADPLSLKDVAAKLQGSHRLSDGRPIMVTAEYYEPAAINSSTVITTLQDKQAMLMEWNSQLYVCYGVTYRRDYEPNTGSLVNTILKFLLLDTRYSDSRREAVFNREIDDWSKVQGMLRVRVAQK